MSGPLIWGIGTALRIRQGPEDRIKATRKGKEI